MPKHPYKFAVIALALGVVYGFAAWFQLRAEKESIGYILLYGMLIGTLSSLSVLVSVALSKTNKIGLYVFAVVTLFIGLIVASSILAEVMFTPSGSRRIGALPVIVTVPLMASLILPATSKRKNA